jgi:hypothetical protein
VQHAGTPRDSVRATRRYRSNLFTSTTHCIVGCVVCPCGAFDAHLRKPISFQQFNETIAHVMEVPG